MFWCRDAHAALKRRRPEGGSMAGMLRQTVVRHAAAGSVRPACLRIDNLPGKQAPCGKLAVPARAFFRLRSGALRAFKASGMAASLRRTWKKDKPYEISPPTTR